MQSYVQTEVRRASRNVLIVNLLGLAAVIAIAVSSADFWMAFFRGPAPFDPALPREQMSYVRIDKPEISSTGFAYDQRYTDKRGRETRKVHHTLYQIAVGERTLLLDSPKALEELQAGPLDLELIDVSDVIAQSVIPKLTEENAYLVKSLLPYMAKSDTQLDDGYWALGALVPLFLAFLSFAIIALRRLSDYKTHPLFKHLAAYGDAAALERKIDQDLVAVTNKENIRVTRHFLLHATGFKVTALPLDEIVWAHKHVLRYNFVLKILSLVVHTKNGKRFQLHVGTMREKPTDELILKLGSARPAMFIGWDAAFDKAWKKQRADVIASFEKRRQELSAGARNPA